MIAVEMKLRKKSPFQQHLLQKSGTKIAEINRRSKLNSSSQGQDFSMQDQKTSNSSNLKKLNQYLTNRNQKLKQMASGIPKIKKSQIQLSTNENITKIRDFKDNISIKKSQKSNLIHLYFQKSQQKQQAKKQSRMLDQQIKKLQQQICNTRTKITQTKYKTQIVSTQSIPHQFKSKQFQSSFYLKKNNRLKLSANKKRRSQQSINQNKTASLLNKNVDAFQEHLNLLIKNKDKSKIKNQNQISDPRVQRSKQKQSFALKRKILSSKSSKIQSIGSEVQKQNKLKSKTKIESVKKSRRIEEQIENINNFKTVQKQIIFKKNYRKNSDKLNSNEKRYFSSKQNLQDLFCKSQANKNKVGQSLNIEKKEKRSMPGIKSSPKINEKKQNKVIQNKITYPIYKSQKFKNSYS